MEHHDQHGGHGDHAAQFRDRFWLSLALTVPVVAYSEMVQEWLGFTPPQFPGSEWVAPVLGTVVFLYGGWPFLQGGLAEARARQPGMMLLISLAILVGFGASAASALGLFDLEFWWELALLIVIMLLGHWLEMRALGQASGALDALAALLPDEAERVSGDQVETVAVADLAVGDVVLVRPGGRVPADGVVVDGAGRAGRVDDHRRVPPGGQGAGRPGGGRHGGHRLGRPGPGGGGRGGHGPGRDPAAGRAGPGVRVAGPGPGRPGRRAAVLVRPGGRAGHAVVWLALGEPDQAVERTVTVLVIACPHALGLAIPLVIAISTGLAARNGILVKDRLALERMRTVDAVLFDKTGTLTKGRPQVTGIAAADGGDDGELLRLAGAVEADSEHPLARAIVAAAEARRRDGQGERLPVHDRSWRPGHGRRRHRGRRRAGPAARARPGRAGGAGR